MADGDREPEGDGEIGASASADRPRVGVSACLAGRQVRYDGGHKLDAFIDGALRDHVELVPICPEVEAGLTVPREAMALVATDGGVRLIGRATGSDHTARLAAWSEAQVAALATAALDGFVFKRRSPSCGLMDVALHAGDPAAPARPVATGLFAARLVATLPGLPVTESDDLDDPEVRDRFLVAVFDHHRGRAGAEPAREPDAPYPAGLAVEGPASRAWRLARRRSIT